MSFKFKRKVSFLLAVVLVIGLLTACGSGGNTNGTASSAPAVTSQTAASTTAAQAEGPLPIVKEPLTLSFFVGMDADAAKTCKTYNDNEAVKELSKRTGINFEFIHPQNVDALALVIAAGDFPDLMMSSWSTFPGGIQKLVQGNVCIELKDLITANCPNFSKYLSEHPDMGKAVLDDSGKMYIYPGGLYESGKGSVTLGPQVRKDWLDKLGLAVPTTIDEWNNVLKAFKDNEAKLSADGKPIIPFLGLKMDLFTTFPFSAWGVNYDFMQVDGTVTYGPIQPGYKEGLALLNSWYKNGWLNKDFATQTWDNFDSIRLGGSVGAAAYYTPSMGAIKAGFVACPYPSINKGEQSAVSEINSSYDGSGVIITTANKHVAESLKLLDYCYSPEGALLLNYGVEGLSYNMVDGKPKFIDSAIYNNPQIPDQAAAISKYTTMNFSFPKMSLPDAYKQYKNSPEAADALDMWSKPENKIQLPYLSFTGDESKEDATTMTDIYTYLTEMQLKFVMGIEPIENFDKYVEKMKQLGIDKAIKIRQDALNRFNSRK